VTIELFARRVSAALALSGSGLLLAALIFWFNAGSAGVVHSIHMVAGSAVALFGVVLIIIGLAISTAIPPGETSRNVGVVADERQEKA
jgi:hypothetical protein